MIERKTYVNNILKYTDLPFVKILTGVRRCGKSTILNMVMDHIREEKDVSDDRILSYRFDSMIYEGVSAKQLYDEITAKLHNKGKCYLFLDEIQEIDGWERLVNSLFSDYDTDIYVTAQTRA